MKKIALWTQSREVGGSRCW